MNPVRFWDFQFVGHVKMLVNCVALDREQVFIGKQKDGLSGRRSVGPAHFYSTFP